MSTGKRYRYITTAIDYANGDPHIGHALEKIGADVMARYWRLRGEDVYFSIGMDEHGQNVLQSAQSEAVTPHEWVDGIAAKFRKAWDRLSLSHDEFIRTTEDRHHRAVHEVIRRIEAAGDFYKGTYAGYYCVRCEVYKSEDDLEEGPDGDLRCPLHPSRDVQWMEEENWFFRLSRYQEPLLKLLEERPEFVRPEIRLNEVRNVIEGGLEDISVSRSRLPWGVPWPDDPDTTVYVWLDALTNYLSAVGFPDEGYEAYWPCDVHVIGKDITRFHCIYWPAFLMSAGIPLPGTVWAHGFVTYGGRRLSKSEGVSFELDEALERHGPDALRYYLVREVPWDGDGDITRETFDQRYTSELANDLGNLANRSLSMVERYREGVVPEGESTELDAKARETVAQYRDAMDAHLLHRGVQAVRYLTSAANVFVEEQAPWSLAKDPGRAGELDDTLGALVRVLAVLASLLHPVIPGKATELAGRLGLETVPSLDELASLSLAGRAVHKGDPLFPRRDLEED